MLHSESEHFGKVQERGITWWSIISEGIGMNKAFLMIAIIVISGCTSIEGTKNKSFTSNQSFAKQYISSLAVLPVKENAVMPGLSKQVEKELYKNICAKLPNTHVIDATTFGSRLASKDLIMEFGKWNAAYEASSFIDARPLAMFSQATGARYFLLVRSTHLSREKIRAVDTGYTGWVSDAKNVWRTDLKISAVLIDSEYGNIIWEGFGGAENINSPRKDIDLGIVIMHQRSPGKECLAPEMVLTATEGLATQIAAIAEPQPVQAVAPKPQTSKQTKIMEQPKPSFPQQKIQALSKEPQQVIPKPKPTQEVNIIEQPKPSSNQQKREALSQEPQQRGQYGQYVSED